MIVNISLNSLDVSRALCSVCDAVTPGVTLCHGVPPKPQRQGSGQALGAGLTVSVKPSALDQLPTGKGSSKFRGVSWHKDNMKWRATIFKGESCLPSLQQTSVACTC